MKTILIVDDIPEVAGIAAQTLELSGYRTIVANGGRDGIKLWREHQGSIDLTIVDILMPDIDGFGVMRELKRLDPNCKIIAMSGTEKLTRDRCHGGLFLAKPFKPQDLIEAVENLLK